MENENFIESLIEERKKIIIEEELLNKSFKRASKLESVLSDTFEKSMLIGWILMNIGVAIWAFHYYDEFTWSRFWYHFFINIYPGFIFAGIIGVLVDPFVPLILHRFYRISKRELKNFKIQKNSLYESRLALDQKIDDEERKFLEQKRRKEWNEKRAKDKEAESDLLANLHELIISLENKKISGVELNERLKILDDDNRRIRAAGYQVEKSITFTNLFKKIEKLRISTDVPKTSHLPIKPVINTPPLPAKSENEPSSIRSPDYQERAKRLFFKIDSEAYFGYRLDWFLGILSNGQCQERQSKLIHSLLKQEFQEYNEIGFIIQPPDYYAQKIKEIYLIISRESNTVENEHISTSSPSVNSESIEFQKTSPLVNSTTKIEDKTIIEIFGNPKSSSVKERIDKTFKTIPKQDFQAVNKQKMDIGNAGESFVYWKEKNKLFDSGFIHLSEMVKHVSKESDSYGYDIISYFEDGTPVYLEVKTTIGGPKTPFDVTNAELVAMDKLDNYYIVRVFDFNINSGKGSTYTVNKIQFSNHFDLEPTSFRARPKK